MTDIVQNRDGFKAKLSTGSAIKAAPKRKTPWWVFRPAELKRLVLRRRKEHGIIADAEFDRAVFTIALPSLIRFPSRPRRDGTPGAGDLAAFAQEYCPGYFTQVGEAHFQGLQAYYDRRMAKWPRHLSAERAGRLLGLTTEDRQAAKVRTIAPIDADEARRKNKRREQKNACDRRRRIRNGATPRAQSLARTEPWKTFGWSRSKWYRLGKPCPGNHHETDSRTAAGTDSRTAAPSGDTDSRAIRDVVPFTSLLTSVPTPEKSQGLPRKRRFAYGWRTPGVATARMMGGR